MTPRQQAFINAYRANGYSNASAAYRAVYPACNTADIQAAKLLGRDEIKLALQEAMAADAKKAELSAARIIKEWEELLTVTKDNNDSVTRARVVENLGKIAGVYVERTEDLTKTGPSDTEIIAAITAKVMKAVLPLLTIAGVPEQQVRKAIGAEFGNSTVQ